MSQKTAKKIRRLEARMNTMEAVVDIQGGRLDRLWNEAVAQAHKEAETAEKRNIEHRRARRAEQAVIKMRRLVYIILAAAIVVEVIAIMAIHKERACDMAAHEVEAQVVTVQVIPAPDDGPEAATV